MTVPLNEVGFVSGKRLFDGVKVKSKSAVLNSDFDSVIRFPELINEALSA